ncbi:MAG: class I SAM-dependent methyltransferase [Ruminococcus sp.]|jgi:ubiquinone/menaquinone biosynthesis C-methylase UbiE
MAFRDNFGNPQGFIGKLMLSGMNMGHSPMAKWAFTQLDVPDDGKLVDIGCGGGFNIRRLLERSRDGFVYGIDISSTSIENQKRRIEGISVKDVKCFLEVRRTSR